MPCLCRPCGFARFAKAFGRDCGRFRRYSVILLNEGSLVVTRLLTKDIDIILRNLLCATAVRSADLHRSRRALRSLLSPALQKTRHNVAVSARCYHNYSDPTLIPICTKDFRERAQSHATRVRSPAVQIARNSRVGKKRKKGGRKRNMKSTRHLFLLYLLERFSSA